MVTITHCNKSTLLTLTTTKNNLEELTELMPKNSANLIGKLEMAHNNEPGHI